MTRVPAVLARVSFAGKEKFLAQCAHDGLVELFLDELMAVHLVHVALALAHGALTIERFVWPASTGDRVLDCLSVSRTLHGKSRSIVHNNGVNTYRNRDAAG